MARPRVNEPDISAARRAEISARKKIRDRMLAEVFWRVHPRAYRQAAAGIDAALNDLRGPIPGGPHDFGDPA